MASDHMLTVLEDFCGDEIVWYTLLTRRNSEQQRELVYFCISKFCFFTCTPENVKAAFEGLYDDDPEKQLDLVPDQSNYAHVTKMIRDTHDSMMFMVVLAEDDPIVLESAVREEVMQEVHIHWKTDYMIRLWQAPSLPILDEWIYGVKRTGGGDIALFTMAPKGKQKIDVLGYFFFCNDKFKPALDAKKKEIPAAYAQGSAERLYVSKDKLRNCTRLGMRDQGNLKVETFQRGLKFMKGLGTKTPPFVLMHSAIHRKRMNLSGDLASWNCWMVHMRTASNDFLIAGCRRKYIPPSGEKYTTVWLEYKGPVAEEAGATTVMEGMIDSLGPSVAVAYYDVLAIQLRVNLMQLDEEGFAFMFNRLVIEPELEDLHIRFYKGCVGLMEIEGFAGASQDAIFEEVDPVDDLFEDVIEPLLVDPHDGVSIEAWAPRVAKYFCFCADGGILPEEIGLDEMCKMLQGKMRDEDGQMIECTKARPTIMRLLDFLVHVAPRGKSYPANGDYSKIATNPSYYNPGHEESNLINRLVNLPDFSFQPRAMIRLLDNEFLRVEMGAERYIKFLYKLLRMRGGQDVRIAICGAIAMLATDKNDRQLLAKFDMIELLLVLVRSKDIYVSSACGRALINLMVDNNDNKDRVVAGPKGNKNIKLLVSKMDSPSEELQMVYAMVIRNICSDQAYCDLFGKANICKILCKLLKPPEGVMVPFAIDQLDKTRAALSACAWKLAQSPENLEKMIDGEAHLSMIDILKLTESESVIEKACGALMALFSTPEEQVKQDMRNNDAMEVFRRCLGFCRQKESLRSLIGAVVILANDEDNLQQLLTLKDTPEKENPTDPAPPMGYVDLLEERADLAKTDKRLEFLVDQLEGKLAAS